MKVDLTRLECVCSPTEVSQLVIQDDARPWGVNASSEPTPRDGDDTPEDSGTFPTNVSSQMVYGAGGRDGQSVFIQHGHLRRSGVIGRRLDVGVVRWRVGAIGRNHCPDVTDESGIHQMFRTL